MNEAIKILRNIGLITLGVIALSLLGAGINNLAVWTWLTSFFTIIRQIVGIFDFMWDTTTLFTLVGYMLFIEALIWTFRGTMAIIKFFRVKS